MPTDFIKVTLVTALVASSALAGQASAAESKTIRIATHYNETQMDALSKCFSEFEQANPDINIEFQQASYGDFLQTILTSRVGGTSPDIYNIYSIWAPQLVAANTLSEPPENVQKWINTSYSDGSVNAATIDETLWGIPTELSVYQLFYNKKMLAEAGFEKPPATWDKLKEIAATITTRNDQEVIEKAGYVFGPSVANAVHVYYSQMFAAGVAPFSDDFRSTNFTSPESIEIVKRQAELFSEGITSLTNITDDFAAGSAAMMIAANWNKAELQQAFGEEFEKTVGIAPIPNNREEAGTMLYSFLWAVDSSSDVKEESWALLEWLNKNRDGMKLSCTGQMLNELGALSGNLSDLEAMDTGDSFTTPFIAAIESGAAKSQPNIWQASENDRTLRSYIEQVWAGNISAEDAMTAADTEVTAVLVEQD